MTKKDSELVTSPNGDDDKQTMYEDELPEMTDEEYDAWYAQSSIPDGGGCRIGPVFKK